MDGRPVDARMGPQPDDRPRRSAEPLRRSREGLLARSHRLSRRQLAQSLLVASLPASLTGLVSCATTDAPLTGQADAPPLLVSAASDLTAAAPELARLYTSRARQAVTFNFGSTGQLAQQVERGAPVDVLAAADGSVVTHLMTQGHLVHDIRRVIGYGQLVLYHRQDSPLSVTSLADLAQPAVQRIALANPDHAPYGRAARQALQAAGLWERLRPRLVLGENVAQALQYAETGNVDLALVALALVIQGQGRWIVIPDDLYDPLELTLVVPRASRQPETGRRFIDVLAGPEARAILDRFGFNRQR